jgi:HSP20 family molecular chaperone IbpA
MPQENGSDDFNMNFCKVLVKKSASDEQKFEKYEEPLIDVMDEGDSVKLLIQARCMEQQVSIHVNPNGDGITICREECLKNDGTQAATCRDVCSTNINLNLKELQIENMLFVVSKCINNNVLEISIPKTRQEKTK